MFLKTNLSLILKKKRKRRICLSKFFSKIKFNIRKLVIKLELVIKKHSVFNYFVEQKPKILFWFIENIRAMGSESESEINTSPDSLW